FLLGADGVIIRGRPRGSWVSGQFEWHPLEAWLPGGWPELPVAEAQAELARRWLRSFGPGTAADLRWWTGWTAGDAKRAVTAAGAVSVELESGSGWVLPDDLEPEPEAEPAVALLPALDPTTMGWTGREWYLGPHAKVLFDRNGNAGPTVWSGGRVVGGWAQRSDGEIVVRFLDDAGREAAVQAAAEAARLSRWMGDARVAPRARARSPLEAELLR
ncbi:MAG: winged helix DNA-binding domain-containing protein, partial [Chloroflexota bacterium]